MCLAPKGAICIACSECGERCTDHNEFDCFLCNDVFCGWCGQLTEDGEPHENCWRESGPDFIFVGTGE